MVHGWGEAQRTPTVVLPHGRLPAASEASSAAHAGRLLRGSMSPVVISTSPGRPADCECKKLMTTSWMRRGSCLGGTGAVAAGTAVAETSATKLRLHPSSQKRVTGMGELLKQTSARTSEWP